MAFIKNQQGEQKLHSFEKLGQKQFEQVTQPQTITASVPLVFMKKNRKRKCCLPWFCAGDCDERYNIF